MQVLAIIPIVVEQHAEEAAFLWHLRDAAASSPHYLLADLIRLDNRGDAHLDGLRIAGAPGWEIVKAASINVGGPGEVFAAAVLAFESGDVAKLRDVLAAGTAKPDG